MRILIFLLAWTSLAEAQMIYSTDCASRYNCTTTMTRVPSRNARIIQVPQSNDPGREARIAQWEAYCKPTFRYDKFGVEHYVFAREGCEYGKMHD
jgi:hypothetical protein